ncbi:MAG: choice-of-anchor D domain-containing protein [Pseudomonadota bacterium]|nr:choice-of-anchor D domain-containing protein [Pseudomonadota bacterium]
MLFLLLAACSENEFIAKDGDVPEVIDEGGPDIVVTPESIDFGEVAWNGEGVATLTIGNVGTTGLQLDRLSLAVATGAVSWTALPSPPVRPGNEVDVVVTWTPDGPGAMSNQLLIDSDDPDEAQVSVPISGVVPYGEILVEPATYDFGTVQVGSTATTTVTVSNVGAGLLTIDEWTYAATDTDLGIIDAGDLGALPAQLPPGASIDVVVQYAPSGDGGDEGSFSLSSNDPDRPSTGAQQFGNGEVYDPCEGFTQTVQVFLTADDAWRGWIDGAEFTAPNQNAWNQFDTLEWELACGDHALSLYATDTAAAIAGVIAVVTIEGTVRFVSGPSNWTMLDVTPPSGWTEPSFDDSAWYIPAVCANTSIWGTAPQPFYELGATWIWWNTDCQSLGEAWLRLNFSVP